MVKSLLKAPEPRSQFLLPERLLSVAKVNLYPFHGKRSGLLDTAKFKGKVSLTAWRKAKCNNA